ncbi:DUF2909 domain-containing protein [Vibrio panuliri]|uniref:DUF2909 domain-containing protein n=1 Tax=Vibrio panuliri TaxID=1381081 RepID=A0A1Q9HNF0_9VIBR|nr:DUF2909 domain-containing protein [Vibrio panuliri]KAB1457707.1 DUF2909 domain-containing protein [Vibrio panuliri]OLQ85809.1 hypothetical protein BIY20_03185 [Vibrio panuliri]OLQ92362.1 hypothetical protein BIY22_16250 [Vibrio panuliri]
MVFIFKSVLVLLLLFIIANLAKALIEMVKGPNDAEESEDQPPMSHYLGKRVILSALAVILMLVALLSGFIEPNSRPF